MTNATHVLTLETDDSFTDLPELHSLIEIGNDSPSSIWSVNINISRDKNSFSVRNDELHFMFFRSTASSVAEIDLIPISIPTSKIKRILSVTPQRQAELKSMTTTPSSRKGWTLTANKRNHRMYGDAPFECLKFSNDILYYRDISPNHSGVNHTCSWKPIKAENIKEISETLIKDNNLWGIKFNDSKRFSILAVIEAFQRPDKQN